MRIYRKNTCITYPIKRRQLLVGGQAGKGLGLWGMKS